jgi:hypothetical protein
MFLGSRPASATALGPSFDVKRPILCCDLRRVVRSQSAVRRLLAHVDCFRFTDLFAQRTHRLGVLLQARETNHLLVLVSR